MKHENTYLDGLKVLTSEPKNDERGSFSRFFCKNELKSYLGTRSILQMNHSCTLQKGAIRGLHFQKSPHAEMKFVRCIKGRIWDVAVDLRWGSPTLFQWFAEELSADNHKMVLVPEGFAHGFQALEANSEILYLTTAYYEKDAEEGLNPFDPKLQILWPLKATILSEKDSKHPFLTDLSTGYRL